MILSQRDASQITLTLNRPDRGNALGAELVETLLTAVQEAVADGSVERLVIRAAGDHFCTGLDLSNLAHSSDGDLLHRLVRIETLLSTLWHAPFHTTAIASGRTWGAGADLFAVCETRVATAGTTFRFPGARFGIALGTRRLAERIGTDSARAVVIQGLQLDQHQALASGLATHSDEPAVTPSLVTHATARAIRQATRVDHRDADLAALVRSAAEPGLTQRIADYARQFRSAQQQAKT